MASKTCSGCGAKFPDKNLGESDNYKGSGECVEMYHELSAYLIMNPDINFSTQHAVDAYGAQHSGNGVKNIRTAFSLVGLCLALDHGYSGRQVQQAHMKLSKQNIRWSSFELPKKAYTLTVADVLAVEESGSRKEMLMRWALDVWDTWEHYHEWTKNICQKYLKDY